jgi:hypothetical protein
MRHRPGEARQRIVAAAAVLIQQQHWGAVEFASKEMLRRATAVVVLIDGSDQLEGLSVCCWRNSNLEKGGRAVQQNWWARQ